MNEIKSDLTVAQKIKAIRQKRGFTQEKLGELSGINAGNIRKYESGAISNPTYKTLEKLANALNVPVLFFVSGGSDSTVINELDQKLIQFLDSEIPTQNVKSLWDQIQSNDEKRRELLIEILKTYKYSVNETDRFHLTITDYQGFSFFVRREEFQDMIERCDKDIRYNIEKLLDESKPLGDA